MPSYGAVDKQPSDAESNAQVPRPHSYQELDMRFLEKDQIPQSDRRRKLLSTCVPILVAFFVILIFAKVAFVAIGRPAQHDPKSIPTEYGYIETPTNSTKSSKQKREDAMASVPASRPNSYSYEYSQNDDTKGAIKTTYSFSYKSDDDTKGNFTAWCTDYNACDELGLIGLCCPTGEGVILGCCK